MRKIRTKIYQWRLRFIVAWRVITWKHKHFVVLNMDDDNFTAAVAESLFDDNYFIKEINLTYVGMCDIHAYYAMLFAVSTYGLNRIPLMKAEFQADVDESMLNANKNADGKKK